VLGPPKDAENGSVREFLIDETNAINIANNSKIAEKRVADVQKTGYFREATGSRRAFNQQYGPKLKVEGVEHNYVKGSDGQLHLLKRVIPVHENSAEPKGQLTQPRQYKADTLRDLAEDVHQSLIGQPTAMSDLALRLDPVLNNLEAKIKTRAFVKKFTDLFAIKGAERCGPCASLEWAPEAKGRVIEAYQGIASFYCWSIKGRWFQWEQRRAKEEEAYIL